MEIFYSEVDFMKLKLFEFEKYVMVMLVFMYWFVQLGDVKLIVGSIGCENFNVFEFFIVVYSLKEKFVLILFELKEVKDKVVEIVVVYESFVIVKEVWEVEKKGFQSDFSSLERDKLYFEVEIDVLRLELFGVQYCFDRFGVQVCNFFFRLFL